MRKLLFVVLALELLGADVARAAADSQVANVYTPALAELTCSATGCTLTSPLLVTGKLSTNIASPTAGLDTFGLQFGTYATDTSATQVRIHGKSAWSRAATNTGGGSLQLAAGLGVRKAAMTAASCGGAVVATIIDAVTNNCTETGANGAGTFDCTGETDAVCATNLATCISAFAGVIATANDPTSGTVYLERAEADSAGAASSIGLTSATPACAAITMIGDGQTIFRTAPAIFTSGSVTNVTTEQTAVRNSGRTLTVTDGSTIANMRTWRILRDTINGYAGGGTETVTSAATLYIDNAPTGSNLTFTNTPLALWIDDGLTRLDGGAQFGADAYGENADGPFLENAASTTSNPTVGPRRSQNTYGLCGAADTLSLCAAANEKFIANQRGVIVTGVGDSCIGASDATPCNGGSIIPSNSFYRITCSDVDGCTYALHEAGTTDGQLLTIVNMGADALTITESAGTTEGDGVALGQYDASQFYYALDRWIRVGGSNN